MKNVGVTSLVSAYSLVAFVPQDKLDEYVKTLEHVYGEGKWDNEIGDAYGVTSTPTYFILDTDKKIESKPVDFETLMKFFEVEENQMRQSYRFLFVLMLQDRSLSLIVVELLLIEFQMESQNPSVVRLLIDLHLSRDLKRIA